MGIKMRKFKIFTAILCLLMQIGGFGAYAEASEVFDVSMQLKSLTGAPLTSAASNMFITASVTVKNNMNTPEAGILAVELYDGDKFIKRSLTTIKLQKKETREASSGFMTGTLKNPIIKTFIWNNRTSKIIISNISST